MHTWSDIYTIMQSRKAANGPILNQMITVRDRYNGDWIVPYLSKEEAPELPPLTPAIISETIDSYGMRAGSVVPAVFCPAVDPTKQSGRRSREYATTRRRIITATYHHSRMNLLLRKAYRHLAGYATAALVVVPDFEYEYPCIKVRDPLNSYPDPRTGEDFSNPENIGFVFAKSADWIRSNWPGARNAIPDTADGDDMWEMVEWIDEEHVVIGLLGPRQTNYYQFIQEPWRHTMELARWGNRTGMVTAICPQRVTLDRIASQLVHVTGITDLMARMMALDIMAKEKSIFPDRYVLGRSGVVPQIVGGDWQDGRTGNMNMVLDAEAIGALPFAPDPTSAQAIDRLERNARISSGLVPQMGGETYGALRTGRGIDALMGAAVDPRIQEMQEVMQSWLPHLNRVILETYKAYWGGKKYTMVSGWPSDSGQVVFTPTEHIETTDNAVSYPIAGADVQSTNIILGQLLGSDAISRKTFRERHPWIDDAASEGARVDEETFERAAMQSLLAQAQTGQLPLIFLAEIETARREDPNGDIFTAIQVADQRMRERQAAEAQPATPEAQPGLAVPEGANPTNPMPPGAPPGGQTIAAPENLAGLRELMNALQQTTRQVR